MNARLASILLVLAAATALPGATPNVSFEQRIGETLPLEARFRDTEGRAGPLRSWLHDRPAVFWFGYATCPQLCTVASEGMVAALRPLQATAGKDFDVIMVTIDPAESAEQSRAKRDETVSSYGRHDATQGWHYLLGDADAIRAVTDAAGFHFTYDARSRQFAHASGFVVVTADGRVSRYFPGVDFAPKDVAAAITRAGRNGLGAKVADLLLVCFRGDGISGRYGTLIWRTLGAAVALTVFGLAGGIGRLLWQERNARHRATGSQP